MKQYIDSSQLDSLSAKAKESFEVWQILHMIINDEDSAVIPSLGQLIQFLYEHVTVVIESEDRESPRSGWIVNKEYYAVELIDALWKVVKDILEKI
jgi:hypothetical protein